jgi:hypothetical protein
LKSGARHDHNHGFQTNIRMTARSRGMGEEEAKAAAQGEDLQINATAFREGVRQESRSDGTHFA